MKASIGERMMKNVYDLAFVGIMCLCLVLAVGAVKVTLKERQVSVSGGGGREVDLPLVRKQMSEGALSERKALYFRKIPH